MRVARAGFFFVSWIHERELSAQKELVEKDRQTKTNKQDDKRTEYLTILASCFSFFVYNHTGHRNLRFKKENKKE